MSSVRAKLSIILKADDVVVAETEDAALWQRVLAVINGARDALPVSAVGGMSPASDVTNGSANLQTPDPKDPVGRFAAQVGVSVEEIQGAFSPSNNPPYLHLDSHCWEAMKEQLPERGTTAVGPIALAGTVLALWLRSSSQGQATQALAQDVLATIGLRDKNASRTVGRVSWLQTRSGGQLLINPAAISRASLLARCFATKDWSAWNSAG